MDFPTVSQTIDSSTRPMLFPQEGSGAARTTSLALKKILKQDFGWANTSVSQRHSQESDTLKQDMILVYLTLGFPITQYIENTPIQYFFLLPIHYSYLRIGYFSTSKFPFGRHLCYEITGVLHLVSLSRGGSPVNEGLAVQVPPPTALMSKCPEPTASSKKLIGKPSITEVAGWCEQPFCVRLGGVWHIHTHTQTFVHLQMCVYDFFFNNYETRSCNYDQEFHNYKTSYDSLIIFLQFEFASINRNTERLMN